MTRIGMPAVRWAMLLCLLLCGFFASALPAATPTLAGQTATAAHCAGRSVDVAGLKVSSTVDIAAAGTSPAYCEVTGAVTTGGDGAGAGSAEFVLKLPVNWNGRFLFLGCGGLCGSLTNVTGDPAALGSGYAVVNTDTGHEAGPASIFDASWALVAPGVPNEPALADYFYRAVHQVTTETKQYVKAYYGRDIDEAYFDGCSTGGRQALIEGERYPSDFDGLIAGDPAMDQVGQRAAGFKAAKLFLPPDNWISPDVVGKLDAAIDADCDAIDGVKDGLIQSPAQCAFDSRSAVRAGLLTPAQAKTLQAYFSALRDPNGRPVSPGVPVGDLASVGFVGMIESTKPAGHPASATPWAGSGPPPFIWLLSAPQIKYLIERNPAFDVSNDWPQRDNTISREALDLLHQRMDAASADHPAAIAEFLRRGGKLIMYHGFSDPLASPYTSIRFYASLARSQHGYEHAQTSARLFMAPGMGHCTGGSGPFSFAALPALDKWVRSSVAPEAIIATNPSSRRTMPLCPFPAEAAYSGFGDVSQASNWSCRRGDRRLLRVGENGREAGLSTAELSAP